MGLLDSDSFNRGCCRIRSLKRPQPQRAPLRSQSTTLPTILDLGRYYRRSVSFLDLYVLHADCCGNAARMYHSEAILLPDGRVLITGSDPQDQVHPQEYRVEVYVPPYLVDGRIQPQITALPVHDWTHGGSFSVTVQMSQNGPIRFSLIGAVASTHGQSMGIRTIFPAVRTYPNRFIYIILTIRTVHLQWQYVHHRCSAKRSRLPVSY